MYHDKQAIGFAIFGTIVLIIAICVVVGCCTTVDSIFQPESSTGTDNSLNMPGDMAEYPILSDSLYQPDTRSWVIPFENASRLEVSPGRGVWSQVEEWEVQRIEYLPDRIEVTDTSRWLHGFYYSAGR